MSNPQSTPLNSPKKMKNPSQMYTTAEGPFLKKSNSNQEFRNKSNQYRSYEHIPMNKPVPQWNLSSAVLRNSSIKWSIPRDQKLKNPKPNYYDHYKIQYPSTLGNRATNFGVGKKADVPTVFANKVDDAAADAPYYQIDDMKLRRSKSSTIKNGKTFGVYASQRVRAPHRPTVHCSDQVRANPGPDKYETIQVTGSSTSKSSIHKRLMMFTQKRASDTLNQPGPQSYKINQRQTRPLTAKANFSYGKRYDFTNSPQKFGVPAFYDIPGFCDKFKNTKIKNLGGSKWK